MLETYKLQCTIILHLDNHLEISNNRATAHW